METSIELIRNYNIGDDYKLSIANNYADIIQQINDILPVASALVVTSEEETDLMNEAKNIRLALRDLRIRADKQRKDDKREFLEINNAIQYIYNRIEEVSKKAEEHLANQEKFVEIQQENIRKKREADRKFTLAPYATLVNIDNVLLGSMSDEDFAYYHKFVIEQYKSKEEEIAKQKEAEELARKIIEVKESKEPEKMIEFVESVFNPQNEIKDYTDEYNMKKIINYLRLYPFTIVFKDKKFQKVHIGISDRINKMIAYCNEL